MDNNNNLQLREFVEKFIDLRQRIEKLENAEQPLNGLYGTQNSNALRAEAVNLGGSATNNTYVSIGVLSFEITKPCNVLCFVSLEMAMASIGSGEFQWRFNGVVLNTYNEDVGTIDPLFYSQIKPALIGTNTLEAFIRVDPTFGASGFVDVNNNGLNIMTYLTLGG